MESWGGAQGVGGGAPTAGACAPGSGAAQRAVGGGAAGESEPEWGLGCGSGTRLACALHGASAGSAHPRAVGSPPFLGVQESRPLLLPPALALTRGSSPRVHVLGSFSQYRPEHSKLEIKKKKKKSFPFARSERFES